MTSAKTDENMAILFCHIFSWLIFVCHYFTMLYMANLPYSKIEIAIFSLFHGYLKNFWFGLATFSHIFVGFHGKRTRFLGSFRLLYPYFLRPFMAKQQDLLYIVLLFNQVSFYIWLLFRSRTKQIVENSV